MTAQRPPRQARPGPAGPGPAVVAFGGGHGLSASLSALRLMSERLTAVVTVADDGGSSGRLRHEMGVLPPGDLRMALSALCDESDWGRLWRDVMQHRFHTDGEMNDHAVGNLLIAALWELLGDPVSGLDWVGRLLGARGRVLPVASVPLEIEADVLAPGAPQPHVVRGQSSVAGAAGDVCRIRLAPADPAVPDEVLGAVAEADWVVLGPGSWFTSVLPHLAIPRIAEAVRASHARRCLTLNLFPASGRVGGMTCHQHLAAVAAHAPGLTFDVVVADPSAVDDLDLMHEQVEALGAQLLLRQVRVGDGTARHDALRLAAAYRDAFEGTLGDVGHR